MATDKERCCPQCVSIGVNMGQQFSALISLNNEAERQGS